MTGDELRTARSIKRNARARECKPKGNVARGIRDLGSIGTLCPCCLFYRLPEDSDKDADAPVLLALIIRLQDDLRPLKQQQILRVHALGRRWGDPECLVVETVRNQEGAVAGRGVIARVPSHQRHFPVDHLGTHSECAQCAFLCDAARKFD